LWSITTFHVDPVLGITTNSRVSSLEEAEAQLRASWSAVREAYGQKEQQRL